MPRLIVFIFAIVVGSGGAAFAQTDMKPSAPAKMMPAGEQARMRVCQKKAADQNVKMDDRAKFVMDCMKEMAKK